jgi:condensin-2 complex subunit G2
MSSSKLRSAVLSACSSSTPIPSLLSLHGKSRQTVSAFSETISSFSKADALKFFKAMSAMATTVISEEMYVPDSCYVDENPANARATNDVTVVPDQQALESLDFLRVVADATYTYLAANKTMFASPPVGGADKHAALFSGKGGAEADSGPSHCLQLCATLHSVLLDLNSLPCSEAASCVNSVVVLCEHCWVSDVRSKEAVISNLLPVVLLKCLDVSLSLDTSTVSASHADTRTDSTHSINRLFHLRTAFASLDWDDASISSVKKLACKTVSSPCFIGSVNGSKFLTYLFTINKNLVTDLFNTVKHQIPDAGRNQLRSYGEMFVRAWLVSDDDNRLTLTKTVFESLVMAELNVVNVNVAKNVRTVLGVLHESKQDPSVDKLLYDLYTPMLARALVSPNPIIRNNATHVLADTFPLHDPTASTEEKASVIVQGVQQIDSCMLDDDVKVRVTGAETCARVLQVMWDTLAVKDVRLLLNTLVTKLACDVTSHTVRAAAVQGVTSILENPSSHGVMKALLPMMSNLIHDDKEIVRLAVVKLLNKIKTLRGIKFYQIVKVPSIHARLGNELPDSVVAKELVNLLLNSYFPQSGDVTASQQMSRTIDFMKKAPDAAKVFYGTLHHVVSVGTVAKLASMLLKCLSTAVEVEKKTAEEEARNGEKNAKGKKGGKKRVNSMKAIGEDEEDNGESSNNDSADNTQNAANGAINASDLHLMATISETIFIIWSSVAQKLKKPEFSSAQQYLIAAFQGTVLTDAHSYFEAKASKAMSQNNSERRFYSNRVCAALLQCAGNMPSAAIQGLVTALTNKLKLASEMSEGEMTEGTAKELTPHIALLCLWGKSEQVCLSLAHSIEKFMVGGDTAASSSATEDEEPPSKKGNKRRQQEISANANATLLPTLNAPCALVILKTIMSGVDASSIAARSNILTDDVARKVLESALESARSAADKFMTTAKGGVLSEARSDVIVGACEIRGRMAIHMEALLLVNTAAGKNDALMELSPTIKNLLSWVSQSAVPVLTGSSSEDSGEESGDLFGLALSPVAKKKTKLDEAAANSSFGEAAAPELSTALGKEMAISLVRSSLVLFGEWLAVGGGGAAEISAFVEKWGAALKTDATVRSSLFLAFSRLFLQLARKGLEGRSFWKAMLECGDLTVAEEGTMKNVFSTIANLKVADMPAGRPLKIAVEEIYKTCANDGGATAAKMPTNLAELMPEDAEVPVVAQFAMALVFNHGPATKELLKLVGTKLKKVDVEDEEDAEERVLAFEERIVGALVMHGGAKGAGEALDSFVRGLERGWGKFGELVVGAKEARLTAA